MVYHIGTIVGVLDHTQFGMFTVSWRWCKLLVSLGQAVFGGEAIGVLAWCMLYGVALVVRYGRLTDKLDYLTE